MDLFHDNVTACRTRDILTTLLFAIDSNMDRPGELPNTEFQSCYNHKEQWYILGYVSMQV